VPLDLDELIGRQPPELVLNRAWRGVEQDRRRALILQRPYTKCRRARESGCDQNCCNSPVARAHLMNGSSVFIV
jgi:hypothetical protein